MVLDQVRQWVTNLTDFDYYSPFHTLGRGPTQAAPGNHQHDEYQPKGDFAPADGNYASSDNTMEENGLILSKLMTSGGSYDHSGAALTADAYTKLYVVQYPIQSGQVQALDYNTITATPNNYTEWTVRETGSYLYFIDVDLTNTTVPFESVFQVRLNINGVSSASKAEPVKMLSAGWGTRYPFTSMNYLTAGDKLSAELRPVGTSATGWKIHYNRQLFMRLG